MRVSFCVQHHPLRPQCLERITSKRQLGRGVEVVTDPRPQDAPSPWRSYKICLETMPAWATHRIIVQDDALVCPGFREAAVRAVRARPEDLVSFFCSPYPQLCAINVVEAAERCEHWAELFNGDWCPVVCLAWPRWMRDEFLAWSPLDVLGRSDDSVVGRWLNESGNHAICTVPNLVQHPDDVPSVMGSDGLARHSVCYIGEYPASQIEW